MTVGVIGRGYVGRSVCELFESGARVVTWDRRDPVPYPAEALSACDMALVCVDTPTAADGHADVSAVEAAIEALPCHRVLLKSTVSPGTTDRLVAMTGKSICFWPEYVGESRYHNPYFPTSIAEVPFVILGGRRSARRWAVDALLPILGPTKTYFQCDAMEAELIKYAENAYFATKVTFVNEYRRICEAFGADWHTVREGWLLDPRVEPMHTAAFRDAPGFDGKCLPKDLRAIVASSTDHGHDPRLLREVLASNGRFRAHLGVFRCHLCDAQLSDASGPSCEACVR